MSVSLPSDKHIEIQQLANALLQRQPITVQQVMAFLTTSCASGHAQHCWLCHDIQSDILNFTIVILNCSFLFTFLFQHSISFRGCLSCSRVRSPCDFHFLMLLLLVLLCPSLGLSFSGLQVSRILLWHLVWFHHWGKQHVDLLAFSHTNQCE